MSEGILALAKEMEDKDEQIERLTAERDSFRVCYDISTQENTRIRREYDRIRNDYSRMKRDLYIAQAALQQAGHHITVANEYFKPTQQEPQSEFAPRPRRVVP